VEGFCCSKEDFELEICKDQEKDDE